MKTMTETAGTKTRRGRKPTTKKPEEVVEEVPGLDGMTLNERIFHIQQEMNPLGRDTPSYQYTYVSYKALWDDGLKPLCAKYHLVYTAMSESGHIDQGPLLELNCEISIAEKPLESESFRIPIMIGSDQKEVGKSLTYYRRYALLSLFGLTVLNDGEDVDAMDGAPAQAETPKPKLDPKMTGGKTATVVPDIPDDEPIF